MRAERWLPYLCHWGQPLPGQVSGLGPGPRCPRQLCQGSLPFSGPGHPLHKEANTGGHIFKVSSVEPVAKEQPSTCSGHSWPVRFRPDAIISQIWR